MATNPVRLLDKEINELLITVALPVFNGGKTLGVAIQSVLSQSHANFELIIFDDASTDNSLEVARSFDDKRIIIIPGNKNIGLSAGLNMIATRAQAEYMARMDQDDICFPDRLEKQLRFLVANPKVDLLATATLVFDEDHYVLGILPVKPKHDEICRRPLSGFYMPHPTWMGHIRWFRDNPYQSSADGAEDQNLLFRSYRHSHYACLPEPLLAYREGKRRLRKLLRSRCIFVSSNARFAWQSKQRCNALKIILIQGAKIVGDTLHMSTGLPFFRNYLEKPDQDVIRAWEKLPT